MRARRPVATVGFVLVVLLAFRAAEAQEAAKVYRVGLLETTRAALNAANLNAFRTGLKELGYIEGRNLVIEYRSADGRSERYPALATELVRSKVDLILTRGTPAVIAAKNATSTIPIVMAAARSVVVGLGPTRSWSATGRVAQDHLCPLEPAGRL